MSPPLFLRIVDTLVQQRFPFLYARMKSINKCPHTARNSLIPRFNPPLPKCRESLPQTAKM